MNQHSKSQDDGMDETTIVILLIFATVVILGIVYFTLPWLKEFWVIYARIEGYLTYFTSIDENIKDQSERLIDWSKETDPQFLGLQMFNDIRYAILAKGLHNYILMGGVLAVSLYASHRWNKYRGIPSVNTLLQTEHIVWPTLEFIKRFNPISIWNELRGEGRFAVSPYIFCVENRILENFKARRADERIYKSDVCEKVYENSLGELFTSYRDMTGFQQLLLLHCLAHELNGKLSLHDDTPLKSVIRLAAIYTGKKHKDKPSMDQYWKDVLGPSLINFIEGKEYNSSSISIINLIIKKMKKQDEEIKAERQKNPYGKKVSILEFLQEASNKHAYNKTILVSLVRYVKRKGRFVSSRMPYFKACDREIFFMLNLTPFYSEEKTPVFVSGFFSEVLGIFSHYQHELYASRALTRPYVGTAVSSVKATLLRQNIIKE